MIIKEGPFTLEITSSGDFFLTITPVALTVPRGTVAQYQFDLTAEDGYDSPVTIEILDLPVGIIPTFSKNPIVPGESSILSIPTSALDKNTLYNLRWRGTEVV